MPDEHPVPDIYSDRFNVNTDPFGVHFVLSRANPPPKQGAENVAILRFSLQNWKVILMTGRKQLREHETKAGSPIHLPKDVLEALKLTEADW